MRKTNEAGVALIKRFEVANPAALPLKAYLCPAGVPTIGYGHIKGVAMGMTCTKAEADLWLREDLQDAELAVERLVKLPISDNQFAALVSWVFNVGAGAAAKSTLIRKLNVGDYDAVPAELARWNQASGRVLKGLVRRRAAEGELWTTADAPAPAPGVKPTLPVDVPEPMPQAVDGAEAKPLARSRTVVGSVLATVSAGASAFLHAASDPDTVSAAHDGLRQAAPHLEVLGIPGGWIAALLSALAVVGGALAFYARVDDSRRGKR